MKTRYVTLAVLLAVLFSCAPATKKDYLSNFASFMETVEKQDKNADQDWAARDKKFELYSDEMYNEFKDELTLVDEVKVNAYRVRYQLRRQKSNFLKELLEDEDVNALRKEIMEYVENGMESDVDAIVKEAEKVGEEFGKAIRDIADELRNEMEKQE